MGRTARPKAETQSHEVPQKDFDGAVRIYRHDIKPAKTKQGEFGQEQSTAFKAIKKGCHIQSGAAKEAFKIAEMEDAHRDDYLVCLNGMLKALKIEMPRDLVTLADGEAGGPVIPVGKRERPKLVTIAGDPNLQMGVPSDGSEADLADAGEAGDEPAADGDTFTEASDEELAQQEGRGGSNDDEQDPSAEAAE